LTYYKLSQQIKGFSEYEKGKTYYKWKCIL